MRLSWEAEPMVSSKYVTETNSATTADSGEGQKKKNLPIWLIEK